MSRRLLPAVLVLCVLTPLSADPIRMMSDPHVANGMIAFSYQGDIWIARDDGTQARRLTNHVAHEAAPRFSPDGSMIAFSSNRMGNYDVFVVPVTGGEPRQLTWHTGSDMVEYWTPDGTGIVISASRSAHPFGSPLYIVPLDGTVPVAMPMDFARAGMISQDGSKVAFNRNGMSGTRKGYKGNNSADLWVQDLRTREFTQITHQDIEEFREFRNDGLPMWGADGMIYFVSERDDIYNIWRIPASGGEPQQVTRHRTGGVRQPAISPDGRMIAYTQEHELYLLPVPNGQPRKVTIDLSFDPTDNRVEWVDVSNRAEGFAPSPDGATVAVDSRGELFVVPSDPEVGEKMRVTRSAWRDRYAQFSPDGKLVAYISDESGEEEIWVFDVASGERRKLTTHPSYKSRIEWAPDGSRIAWTAANRLFETDVARARTTELGHNPAGGYTLGEYSADGKWLVYDRSDDDQNSDVFLFEIAGRREINVTPNPFRDRGGMLTPDGRHIVFNSNRDGGTTHLFAVSLRRITEDPDDPLVRARTRPRERNDSTAARASELQIQVDVDGIDGRAVQLTSGENAAGSTFLSRDGRSIYFTSSDSEGAGLFLIGVDGRDQRKVTTGSFPGLTPTWDRRTIFYRGGGGGGRGGGGAAASGGGPGGEVFRMALASPQRKERIPFSFTVEVDQRAEWEQIFNEAWRVMKYRFYDEKMHGVDWDRTREQYRPLLRHVGTYEEAYELANLMIGELNASHTGVSGPGSRSIERGYSTQYLGFEMEPEGDRFRITHIYRNGPADREWLNLAVGDYVLAIDGHTLAARENYWKILNHLLNDYIPVRVAKSANGQDARDIRIRTVSSLNELKYEEWVAKNREFVQKESNGQIAYVHIRSMNQPSLERFRTEINQFWNAAGIVVDIRYNGGGNIDQELIDILEREPYQFWNSRWGARTWGRRPREAIAGPKVMLINNRSASDSEVTPMGFRQLGLGRIVGHPTAAAVIATGSYGLINGGSIRTPGSLVVTWDPSQPNNYGINLENYGVAPDVFARNTPDDELRGFDRELKAAVDEALRMLRDKTWRFSTDGGGGGGR